MDYFNCYEQIVLIEKMRLDGDTKAKHKENIQVRNHQPRARKEKGFNFWKKYFLNSESKFRTVWR